MSSAVLERIDPAYLAMEAASRSRRECDTSHVLDVLGQAAASLSLTNVAYWVKTQRAFTLPAQVAYQTEAQDSVRATDTRREEFLGTFICYSKIEIGELIEPLSGYRTGTDVQALCLVFPEVAMSSSLGRLPEEHLLHVPVLAIDEIEPVPLDSA